MGRRRKLRKTEVVFQQTDGKWMLSTPTHCGFKHTNLGRCRDRAEAETKALKELSS